MTDDQPPPHSQDDTFAAPPRGKRYFFDSRDNGTFIQDDVGLFFLTLEQARDEAARALAEMARDVLPGSERRELAIEVRDEEGEPLLRASLVFEAVRLR